MPDRLSTFLRSRRIDWFNLFVWVLLAFYLLPVGSMIVTAFMSTEQLSDPDAPLYPAKARHFIYKGQDKTIYNVPTATGSEKWALVNAHDASSQFVDPQHPEKGLIEWHGNWKSLTAVYEFSLSWENFLVMAQVWDLPHMLGVTLFMVVITEVGVLYIFLLRQNFKGLPIDLEEAAMLDGAGPLRRLFSIILPQSWPVVVTVSLLHFFYIWNEVRQAALYVSANPLLTPLSFSVQNYANATQNVIEATTLLVLALPVILLFLSQRLFLQGMIFTGAEKKE